MNRTCMTCEHYNLRLSDDPCCNCYGMENGNFSEWKHRTEFQLRSIHQQLDPMGPEVFKSAMEELAESNSLTKDARHKEMDSLMCKVLKSIGYGDGVDIFKKTK